MRITTIIKYLLICSAYWLITTSLHAETQPKFTLTPTTATTVTVPANRTATVIYRVTNMTKITRQLTASPIFGITQVTTGAGVCANPFTLATGESCLLTLLINGAQLSNPITQGPVVCKTNGPNNNTPDPFLCSQPSQEDSLNITGAANVYVVTPSGTNVAISPSTPQTVSIGTTQAFTVTANTGYTLSPTVGGTCPLGSFSGSTYTTGAITANCTVSFSATIDTFTVDSSGTGVTISPSGQQTVNYNATQAFTVIPNAGYSLPINVTGNCPSGTWNGAGTIYTTGNITFSCFVIFTATPIGYTVTVTPNSGIASTVQTPPNPLSFGGSQTITVTLNPGYLLSSTVGGTCPHGSLSGNTIMAGPITSDCSITFTTTLIQLTVNPSGTGVTITPSGPQTVDYNTTQAFNVNPNSGYSLPTTVAGTCPAGTWNFETYTTGNITVSCSVIFTATPIEYTVTVDPDPGIASIIQTPPNPLSSGESQVITVTLNPDYVLFPLVSGTCPHGSLSGNTITAGPITVDCNITFSTIKTYTITSSSGFNGSISPSGHTIVNSGANQSFTATPAAGYSVAIWTVDGVDVQFGGTGYTLSNIQANHTVDVTFSATPLVSNQTVPAAPTNVIATAGNASVAITWTPPTNPAGIPILGYTVSTVDAGGALTTICMTSVASCTVTGLTNGTTYTFAVSAANYLGSGPLAYSSPVTPDGSVSVNPSTLALNHNGTNRTITITNTSAASIMVTSTPISGSFSPLLPTGTTMTTTCMAGQTLLPNDFCTVTILPGTSLSCIPGSAAEPIPSVLTIYTNVGNFTADVVVLNTACFYQSGYIFTIDDTTPSTSSIGGEVAEYQNPGYTLWSEITDPIWGISETSIPATPNPSNPPATLLLGQLNCDGANDGGCATNNLTIFYPMVTSPNLNYAFSQCRKVIGSLSDWYLPSICELAGSNLASTCSSQTQNDNISTNLMTLYPVFPNSYTDAYWSSTEYEITPTTDAMQMTAISTGNLTKTTNNLINQVICARLLTL